MKISSELPSLIDASTIERQELDALTAREKGWYSTYPRFATNDDILHAARGFRSRLKIINPDRNLMPIARLREPELIHEFPPYLLKESAVALRAIGQAWRERLEQTRLHVPEARLAITSMARSVAMQNKIVNDPTKLATPNSTHTAAAAFDIDASGYYIFGPDGLTSITHPGRDRMKTYLIQGRLMKKTKNSFGMPQSNEPFRPTLIDALLEVADTMHQTGQINAIVEYAGTPNQCLHIAPNPEAIDSFR